MKYLIATILCFALSGSRSQVNSFTAEPEKFLSQLEKHLGSFDKKDSKEFTEKFTPVWMAMSASDQRLVVATCNVIQEQKLRIYPEFKNYINAVYHLYRREMGSQVFIGWNTVVNKVLDQRQKQRKSEILESSSGFFESGNFYQSNKLAWNAKGGSFEWGYDNVPYIRFTNIRLACYANEDSSVIHNTSGTFLPYTDKFDGRGGRMNWTRSGLDTTKTYVVFNSVYDINVKTSSYKLDSVEFYNTYFDYPLKGKITEKVLKVPSSRKPQYPQFESYSQRLTIKNVFPEVDYEGGFIMIGETFKGSGTYQEPARLTFYQDNQPFFVTSALDYSLTADRILSEHVAVKMLLGKDSIVHPGLYLLCLKEGENKYVLKATRGKDEISLSPFISSYHKLEMYFQTLQWVKGDSTVRMGPDLNETRTEGKFQSLNYFDKEAYYGVGQGMSANPVVIIGKHAIRFDQFVFPINDLATAMGLTVSQFTPMLYNLINNGFVTYDKFSGKVYINQKLFDYMEYAAGIKDHDDVSMESNAYGRENASLNLNTRELRVKGLKVVTLSDRKYVKAFPGITDKGMDRNSGKEVPWGELSIFENRNIVFDGIFLAGSTEFFGVKFNFDYDNFKVEIPECDSMRIRVWPFEGGEKQIRLISVIEELIGGVSIDDPSNRSGRDTSFNHYPILNSTKESYVYYDNILGGVYPKESFRYVVSPFVMDSLTYVDKQSFRLRGKLQSAGIFPDFTEDLMIMRDYSLGFTKVAPPAGLGLYADKGNFKNKITLTAKGLQGEGTINYVTSSSISSEWYFFPDSTVGIVDSFINKAQGKPVEIPSVKGYKVKVNFNPTAEVLTAESQNRNLLKFFGEADMKGKLFLRPKGMRGRGRMIFGKAQIAALNFYYTEHNILSDTAAFYLQSLDEENIRGALAFKTENVSANIDFKARHGLFKKNGDNSFVEFPDNQYICYMDEFKWYMDDGDIELQKKTQLVVESTSYEKPNVYSIHPDQDSLSFMAPKARYDMKKKTVTCTEVAFVDVADARIVPDSGVVVIRKKAKIETLKNAEIIANNVTQNHRIVDATVDIFAKRSYLGSGNYFYVDEDKNSFKINFAKIEPDSSYTTYAEGFVKEEENFKLNKHFDFKGKVELYAVHPALIFDGATRVNHLCEKLDRNWLEFRSQVDPLDIHIPIESKLVSNEGKSLAAGLFINLNSDSLGMYPAFLSSKGSATYPDVVTASGFLYFDKGSKEYRIASKDKLQERSIPGNYVSLHAENCVIEGDGKLSFGSYTGQVSTGAIGIVSYNIENKDLSMRAAVSIDFPFVDKTISKIADNIKANQELLTIDLGKTFYGKALKETLDQETAEKIEADILLGNGIKRFPDELNKAFYLADVRMKWDKDNTAFVSEGLIGVANIYKDELFRYVRGKIVIEKQRRNTDGTHRDKVKIYLESDDRNWYYFEYSNNKEGRMEVSSSDKEFMKTLTETNEDKLKYKGEKGVEDFEILALPSSRKKTLFLDTYE